ncbi:MAG: 50S ribosomal protein L25/general stress protein Ctc [Arenicellales bacterium]|jgi:large subunit ribosomal protein L25|nr:50S ribosomal protein L25/general stress protein Ctc [Arenicellales bacterium]|tara:strand:+ start:3952 stop:4641 length:690 start_codon:yes stop_codon:yes gene_type:complete
MSSNYVLDARSREAFGTSASRRQRLENQVPAVVYGAGKDNETLILDHHQVMHSLQREAFHSAIIDLKTQAGSQQVILRQVQMHPHRPIVLHIDFQRIKATETLHMKVPLHFEGADVAPGVKMDGGILAHPMMELDITCLPKDLPEYIALDVSEMQMNDSLHLSDVQLPEGVELTATAYHEGDDPTVAIITAPKVIEEEVPEEAEEDEVGADGTEADSEPDAVEDDKGGE